ncbi:hypothetical protein [Streptomyces sp. NPDC014894]|uniref:hypothetical protein n=1 Tax=Streptomyces sp. NPDC014894 TaxID=3364931 RepID=UPI003702C743
MPVAARMRGHVLGLGIPAVCFLMVTAFVGFSAGERFIDNVVFSKFYGLFVTGMALVPMRAWRIPNRRRDPGYWRVAWFPALYIAAHGVLYSHDRSSANIVLITFGWSAFAFGGAVGMYLLGQQMWDSTQQNDETDPTPPPASA